MAEDATLELAQLEPRLQTELGDEQASYLPVGGQGIGLAAAAIERRHQLAAQVLPEGMFRDEPLEAGRDFDVAAKPKLGIEPILQAGQTELVQARCLLAGKRHVVEVGERLSTP